MKALILTTLAICLSGCASLANLQYHGDGSEYAELAQQYQQTPKEAPQKRINMQCKRDCMQAYFDHRFCDSKCSY